MSVCFCAYLAQLSFQVVLDGNEAGTSVAAEEAAVAAATAAATAAAAAILVKEQSRSQRRVSEIETNLWPMSLFYIVSFDLT